MEESSDFPSAQGEEVHLGFQVGGFCPRSID